MGLSMLIAPTLTERAPGAQPVPVLLSETMESAVLHPLVQFCRSADSGRPAGGTHGPNLSQVSRGGCS